MAKSWRTLRAGSRLRPTSRSHNIAIECLTVPDNPVSTGNGARGSGAAMTEDNGRFGDTVHFEKVDPVKEQQLAEGRAAALQGEPDDEAKPGPWRRGYQIGRYQLEGDADQRSHTED